MLISSENFALRFLICAVLLVVHAKYAAAQWNFYAASVTLVSLKLENTFGLFNITGDTVNDKIIEYGKSNTQASDNLKEINVLGYVNGEENIARQSESEPERDLCSILERKDGDNGDYVLRYMTTTLLLDGADKCPLPQGKQLISRGFTSTFWLDPKHQVSCSKPWNYRLVMEHDSDTVLEAVFQIDMKPLYACESK